MWHKAEWMGRPMRLELTCVGLLVQLANCYTTRGALNLHGKGKPAKPTSFYRRAPNEAGGLYLRCQDDMPNTFAWVMSLHPYIHPVNAMWIFLADLCVRPLLSQPIFFIYILIFKIILIMRQCIVKMKNLIVSFIPLIIKRELYRNRKLRDAEKFSAQPRGIFIYSFCSSTHMAHYVLSFLSLLHF